MKIRTWTAEDVEAERETVAAAKKLRLEWEPGGDATSVSLVAVGPDGSENPVFLLQRVAVTVAVGQETVTEIAHVSLED